MADLSFEGDVKTARTIVIGRQWASINLIQRQLRVGPSRAFKILDALQDQGVVGPPKAGGMRDVLRSVVQERSNAVKGDGE